MRTHPDIGLMIATCSKSAADLLQLARFWLCMIRMQHFCFKFHCLLLIHRNLSMCQAVNSKYTWKDNSYD